MKPPQADLFGRKPPRAAKRPRKAFWLTQETETFRALTAQEWKELGRTPIEEETKDMSTKEYDEWNARRFNRKGE